MPYPYTASVRGAAVLKSRAQSAYADIRPTLVALRDQGLSCHQIAAKLNQLGHRTRRGHKYKSMQVWRVLRLYCGVTNATPAVERDDPRPL